MRFLPLYPRMPVVAVEAEEPRVVDPGCQLCPMHEGVRNACLSAEGEPGGLLVVGESPGRNEDAQGRPFVGESGKLLRKLLAAHWTGPLAIDNALRCAPGQREVKDRHVDRCRGYLAQTFAEARPTRVVVLGGWAAYAVTGRGVAPLSSRRGYTYLLGGRFGSAPVPVFFVLHPAAALRNRFVRRWFEEDLRWALTCPPPPLPPLDEVVRVVTTPADAEAAVAALSAAEWASVDVETAGVMFDPSFRLLCVSACAKGDESPWAWDGAALDRAALRGPLERWLADPDAKKVGANVKFDELALESELSARSGRAAPLRIRGVVGDVRLWRKLLEPEADGKLDKMVELVGMGGMKEEARDEMAPVVARLKKAMEWERRLDKRAAEDRDRAGRGEPPKKWPKLRVDVQDALGELHRIDREMPDLAKVVRDPEAVWEQWAYALVPPEVLLRYNARDTCGTTRVGVWCEERLRAEPELDRTRRLVIDRAAHAVRRIEGWGIQVDPVALDAFESYLSLHLHAVRAKLDAHAGKDFDPDSHPQVRALLFDKLGLKPPKGYETPTGLPSTSAEVLELLEHKHPVVREINRWRTYSKLQGTYGVGMRAHVRADGRIHTSILLDGARSGRTSSQNPNLQNIPRAADSPEGKMARDIFVARPGWLLLELDYSQIELRIAAMLSGDPEMISIFRSGVDYHRRTAELVARLAWGIDPSQVQDPHRTQAKTINFSTLYGAGIGSIAARLGITYAQAERVVNAIMGHFKRLSAFIDECVAETRRTGYAWTWWAGQRARRRPLYRIADQDDGARITAENGAFNTPVQGTANEFCVASVADAVEWLEDDGLEDVAHLVVPIHDAMLFEVREDWLLDVAEHVRHIMLAHDSQGVPMEVDAKVGRAFGSLVKLPLKDRSAAEAVLAGLRAA